MRIFFVLLIAIIASACASTANYNAPKHQVGQTFQNSFVIGIHNTNIPLPEGEWRLIGYQQKRDDDITNKLNQLKKIGGRRGYNQN